VSAPLAVQHPNLISPTEADAKVRRDGYRR
jgi:hypothetical protein